MIDPPQINGFCAQAFSGVRDAFAANFADGHELGARFTLIRRGETVVDLWAGFADRGRTRPFDEQTLTPVASTTKMVTAMMMARLVEAEKLWYDQPVAEIWPEFGTAGKDEITVEQMLSHQGGLAGFPEPMDPQLWFDWDAICEKIALMAPLWPPGSASGYHPVIGGYISGELFRRLDGRKLGDALREDIAGPAGLDLWIGLPDSEDARCADLTKPKTPASFGEITPVRRAAFMTRWSSPPDQGSPHWRRFGIPSANGHATAPALATLMAALAGDGRIGDVPVLDPQTIAAMTAERIHGPDLVLPFTVSWAAGPLLNGDLRVYGPNPKTFGHSGRGGSCAFADRQAGLAGAYVMNAMSNAIVGDARSVRLIDAAYAAL